MSDHSGQQIVILTTIWWWQKLGRDWHLVKKATHKFPMEMFNLRKLKEVEGKEQYRVEISYVFAALENLVYQALLISSSASVRKNIKISVKES
jgi:ABC-type hemin transport system ATPase subunit